jgi:uncharacterized protein
VKLDAPQFASCFYEGSLVHRRHGTIDNAFRYPVMMAYLDLNELEPLFASPEFLGMPGLWSKSGPALASFRRADYYGDPTISLSQSIRALVASRLGFEPSGPIRLLTNFRLWGMRMNPVSFYYCYDSAGTSLSALVAEVRNTPWNEAHCYVVDLRHKEHGQAVYRFTTNKVFHVSPFLPLDLSYSWQVRVPKEQLFVHIAVQKQGETLFDASLALRRRPLNEASKADYLCKYPLQTVVIWLRIYWQAFRLWRKKATFYPHPSALS